MTVQSPPLFLQAGSHPAEDVRRLWSALVEDQEGILFDADLAPTQNGTPNMSVNVAGGRCFIGGDEATYQGTYFCENRGTTNISIDAADATNPRYDLIVAKVQDAGYSGATNSWSLAKVTGTPAGSPSVPTAPSNSIILARVTVGAGVTSITNANILDQRSRWDSWRKPRSAACTSQLSTTSSGMADITGCSLVVVTPRASVTVVVQGIFDFDPAATDVVGSGALLVDGSQQTSTGIFAYSRSTYTQTWVVTIASAASHTIKLQANRVAGSAAAVYHDIHTKIVLLACY